MFRSDPLPASVNLIALISFASTPKRLTHGSERTLLLAEEIANLHKGILVFGGTYFDNPKPNIEREEKQRILGDRFIWTGSVSSTTDERRAIEKEVRARNLEMKNVVIVDEEYHSIRTRIVWQHYHPETNFSFQLIPGSVAADPENPMPLQRSALKWLLANIALAPFFKWYPGVEWWDKRNFNQSFK